MNAITLQTLTMYKIIRSLSFLIWISCAIPTITYAQDAYTGTFWVDGNFTAKFTQPITSGVATNLNVPAIVAPGLHTINGYLTSTTNIRGSVFSDYFYKVVVAGGVTQYEYWLDNNLAQKKTGKLTKLTGALFYLDIPATLQNGYHIVSIRFKVNGGMWSGITRSSFEKNSINSGVTQGEYWFDENYAAKKTLAITNPLNVNGNLDITGLTEGSHVANIRFQINGSLYSGITSNTFTVPTCDPLFADGFDYPFGDKGYDVNGGRYTIAEGITPECNNLYPSGPSANPARGSTAGGWHNANDVGNYLKDTNLTTCGLHPGEDWNFNSGTADVGQKVYAIANGVIEDVAKTYTNTNAYGYRITIEHTLPNGTKLWSLYLHITDSLTDGKILSIPTYAIGQPVKRGDVIGKIAKLKTTTILPHLHLEIRTTNPGAAVWASDNGNGYYTDLVNVPRCDGITLAQVTAAFANMTTDGIIDPSDFIEHNRRICNAGVQTAVAYPPYNCVAFAPQATANDKLEMKNNSINIAAKVSISPNPASAILHITGLPKNLTGNDLELLNAAGITVKKWQRFNGTEINVSALPAGLYLLRINSSTTLKFIKE